LIKEDSTKVEFYVYRGVAYFNLKNYAAALSDNNMAVQLDPTHARARYNRAAAYKALGNYKDALADVLKAQSLGYPVEASYLNELKAH